MPVRGRNGKDLTENRQKMFTLNGCACRIVLAWGSGSQASARPGKLFAVKRGGRGVEDVFRNDGARLE
jgi:hypothetical protein